MPGGAQVQPAAEVEPLNVQAAATAQETPAPTTDPLASAAAVYATYHGDVTDIKRNSFQSSSDIQAALRTLGGQNSEQLARGWMAYSALVASQTPEFRAALRDVEGFYGKDAVVRGLQNDTDYAHSLHGGRAAVRSALGAVEADSQRLVNTAAIVKEQAYTLQAQSWAKGRIGDSGNLATQLRASSLTGRPARNGMVSAFSAPGIDTVLVTAGSQGATSVWENVSSSAVSIRPPESSGTAGLPDSNVAAGKKPIADRIATLAAYRILGANDTGATPVKSALTEKQTEGCLTMAQLNLQQCIAATHQHFEVPFCIGEHALADVGRCISKVSQ